MTRLTASIRVGFALLATACGSSSPALPAPTVPTPVQYAFAQISGNVSDTAFRPLGGVRVEIVDGSQAGASTTTDAGGHFSFSGASFVDGIKFRATRDGYAGVTVSGPLQFSWPSPVAYLAITLESLVSPVKIEAGNYALTVVADKACTDIPGDLRTRTYAATIAPAPPTSGLPPNTRYFVEVSGPSLSTFGFGIGVAGNDLRFEIDGPAFFEHLPPFTYLEIAGAGGTSVETPTVSTISIPFSGSFQYCDLKSEMGRSNNCYTTPVDQKIAYAQCLSMNDRMILTRR
jgi:Carboxypeptidase regulatory-like domain